jgi:hypothetical protein
MKEKEAKSESGQPDHTREAVAASVQLQMPDVGMSVTVERGATAAVPEATRVTKPIAVLVIHGMGQQLPFETLDTVASGLYTQDIRVHGETGSEKPRATTVEFGDQWVQRAELVVRDQNGDRHDIHVYEAYWSPLTEGVVKLRDVASFLLLAGINGLKNGRGFSRQLFQTSQHFNASIRTLIYLLIALSVAVSAGIIGTAAAVIPAARSPFKEPPAWLSDALFSDLTGLFNAVVRILVPFVVAMGLSVLLSRYRGLFRWYHWLRVTREWLARLLGVTSLACFVVAIFAVLAAGIGVPLLIALHKPSPDQLLLPPLVQQIAQINPPPIFWRWALGVVVLMLAWPIAKRAYLTVKLLFETTLKKFLTSTLVVAIFLGIVYALWRFVVQFDLSPLIDSSRGQLSSAPIWGILIVASLVTRSFLIQYLGDVVVYLESHKLDRFFELRQDIRKTVLERARLLYAQGEQQTYDDIHLVGHSLGSVIAYDTLNSLMLMDQVSEGKKRIADRTKLLLTFGSPLDKTAYIFATQQRKSSTKLVRQKLVSAAQPLISVKAEREKIDWINIYSPWDIISGPLEFYDHPAVRGVRNEKDPEAVTLLGAHTEYWRNWLVYQRLWEAIVKHPPMPISS